MKHCIATLVLVYGLAHLGFAAFAEDPLPPNLPPEVTLTHPPHGAEIPAGADILLVAEAWDHDGIVISVEFLANDRSLGVVGAPPPPVPDPVPLDPPFELLTDRDIAPTLQRPFRLSWENVPAGEYTLVAVASDDHGNRARSEPVPIMVIRAQHTPVVSVKAVDPDAAEGPGPNGSTFDAIDSATFVVGRNGPTGHPLTVYYRLTGSALNGEDYRELPTQVVIPAGHTRADVVVWPIDDELAEGTESVVLTLREVLRPDGEAPSRDSYDLGRYHQAEARILDNEEPTDLPPHVRLVQPENGETFQAGSSIHLLAFAADEDGEITQVEFFDGRHSLGIVFQPTPPPLPPSTADAHPHNPPPLLYQLSWDDPPIGSHLLAAAATDTGGNVTRSQPIEILVIEDAPLPLVTIETVDGEAAEPILPPPGSLAPIIMDSARLLVSRTGTLREPLVVYYGTRGTAINGVDFAELSGRVELPAGRASAPIEIFPLDDEEVEGDEFVSIQLAYPPYAAESPLPAGYRIGEPSQARAVIHDNDTPTSNLPPRVELTHPLDGTTFSEGDDIRVVAKAGDPDGMVTRVEFFANGTRIGAARLDPATGEPYGILWEDLSAGAYRLMAVATDDDGATTESDPVHIEVIPIPLINVVNVVAIDALASEGGNAPDATGAQAPDTASFRVTRDGPRDHSLIVYYDVAGTAANGEDYERLSGEVLIEAGSRESRIIVIPIDDTLHEETESVVVKLQPIICITIWPPPPECYQLGHHSEAEARILDNDPPPGQAPEVQITRPQTGDSFIAPATIPVSVRTRDPDGYVSRMRFFANGQLIEDQTLYFFVEPPPGQVQIFEYLWEGVPAGEVELQVVATDDRGQSSRSAPVQIRVRQHPPEPAAVNVFAVDPIASEGATPRGYNPALFRIRRAGTDLGDPLTVDYAIGGTADNGIDYEEISGQVTIEAGRRSAPIRIGPVDDSLPERIETVVVEILVPEIATAPYRLGHHPRAGAIIVDNDFPFTDPPCVSAGDGSVYVCTDAPDGETFEIQVTTDFQEWTPLETLTASDGSAHFLDPDAGADGVKAYRFVPVDQNYNAADD